MSVGPSKAGFLEWLRDRAAAPDASLDFRRLLSLASSPRGDRAVDALVSTSSPAPSRRAQGTVPWGVGDPVEWKRDAWEKSSLPSELKDRIEAVERRGVVQGFEGPLTFVTFPAAPGERHGAIIGLQTQAIHPL